MKNEFLNAIRVPSSEEVEGERAWIQSEIERIGEKKLRELIYPTPNMLLVQPSFVHPGK